MVAILNREPAASNFRPIDSAGFLPEDLHKLTTATKLFQSGRFEDALRVYRELRRAHELEADLWNLEGVALLKLGRYQEAEEIVKPCLRLQPDDPSTLGLYGAILGQLGRHSESAEFLRKAFASDPSDSDIRYNLALALARLGNHKEAVTLIDELPTQRVSSELADLRKAIIEDQLWRLVDSGFASWSGGKPKGSRKPVKVTPGPPVSDYIIEDRR